MSISIAESAILHCSNAVSTFAPPQGSEYVGNCGETKRFSEGIPGGQGGASRSAGCRGE